MDPNQQPQYPQQPEAPTPVSPTSSFANPQPAAPPPPAEQPFAATPQSAFPTPSATPAGPSGIPQQQSDYNPGKILGIVGIILSILGVSLIGLILAIISRKKSKEANAPTTLGTIGIILSIISLVIGAIFMAIFISIAMVATNSMQDRANATNTSVNATQLAKHAEVYNAENGNYPASVNDIDTTNISEDVTITNTTPTENGQIQYIQCDEDSAQVLYYSGVTNALVIQPLGNASATSPC